MTEKSKKPQNGLTPEKYAKDNSEHSQQVALFIWVQQEGLSVFPELQWLHAIPNGGERSASVAAAMKAEGVKSGVSDLFLPVARHGCHGLYIEMKKPAGGTVSNNQEKWIADMRANGYGAIVCWSWIEAKNVLIQYLSPAA